VLTNGLFIVAEQIGNIGDRHAALQQDSRKGVPETVWSGGSSNAPARSKTLPTFRRHISVTVSSRSE
jgi:hypothetical protein